LRVEAGIDGVKDFLLRIGSHAAAPILGSREQAK
jgi:hypothetical protein